MEDLLKPSTPQTEVLPPVEPVEPVIEEEKPEDILKPGKFFDFPTIDVPSSTPNTQTETGNGFTFNNFVDAPVSQAAPSMPETPASIDAILGTNPVAPTQAGNISQPEPVEPTPQEPIFDDIVLPPVMPSVDDDSDEVVIPASFASQPAAVAPAPVQSAVAPMQPTTQTNNVMTAVNILRDAARRIEQLGFAIDTDEIDLENMYQIIIKIDK